MLVFILVINIWVSSLLLLKRIDLILVGMLIFIIFQIMVKLKGLKQFFSDSCSVGLRFIISIQIVVIVLIQWVMVSLSLVLINFSFGQEKMLQMSMLLIKILRIFILLLISSGILVVLVLCSVLLLISVIVVVGQFSVVSFRQVSVRFLIWVVVLLVIKLIIFWLKVWIIFVSKMENSVIIVSDWCVVVFVCC